MNRIYKVVWSKAKNCYVVASELAKRHTKSPRSSIISRTLVASVLACVCSFGAVLPVSAAGDPVTYDDNTYEVITLEGVGVGYGTRITNLADGSIAAASTDAVTGAQLYATNQQIATLVTAINTNTATIGDVQTDVSTLKTNYTTMRSDVNTLQTQVETGFNVNANGAKVKQVNPASNYINFKSGNNITVAADGEAIKISAVANGAVATGNTGLVTGDTVAGETRVASDGNYITVANTAGANLVALDGAIKVNADAIDDINDSAVKYDGADKAKVTLAGAAGTTIDNVKDGALSATSKEAVNGSQLYTTNQNLAQEVTDRTDADTALSNRIGTLSADGNYITQANNVSQNLTALDGAVKANEDAIDGINNALDDKANVSLDNIDAAGETVVKDLAKEAVKVVAGTNTTVTEGTDGDAKTYAVNVTTNGAVVSGDTGIVTGGTVYDALQAEARPAADGNYIAVVNTAGANLTALDTAVKANEDAIADLGTGKANVALDNITDAGKTVIQDATNVVSGDSIISVTPTTAGGVKTYTVTANISANGQVATGDTGLVSGDTVYTEVRPASDGNYIATSATTGANLTALDTQVKANEDAIDDINDAMDDKANVDASNVSTHTADWGSAIGTGVVASGNGELVTGGTVYDALQIEARPAADGNYIAVANTAGANLTALDNAVKANEDAIADLGTGKANVALDNITDAGKTVIQDATNIVSGDSIIDVTSATAGGVKTYTVKANITADGQVASGDTGLVSGDTVYTEVRPASDGEYVKTAETTGANLLALDTQVKANKDAVDDINDALDDKANVSLDNIDTAGEGVVRDLAKEAVKVVNGTNTTVTEGTDGDAKTYAVDVTVDGVVASGNTGIVDGGTVYDALQDQKDEIDIALDTKANKDASNVASDADKWATAIGTGTIDPADGKLVTGATVAGETRVATNGNYVLATNTAGQNLSALDRQVKANEDAIDNIGDALDGKANVALDNITTDGRNVVKGIAQEAVSVVNGDHTTVTSEFDPNGNKTYSVNVADDGTVTAGDTKLVTGGTVYDALQDMGQSKLNTDLSNISEPGKDVITGLINVQAGNDNTEVTSVVDRVSGIKNITVSALSNGQVAQGDTGIVTGGTVYDALQGVSDDLQDQIDTKANRDMDNLTTNGERVLQQASIDAVKVGDGDNTTVASEYDADGNITYKVTATTDGVVANADTGIVSGGTVFAETRVPADGNYITAANTAGQNISALDTALKATNDAMAELGNDAVKYDSATKSTVTLAGEDGTKITNVKEGTLAADSTDAVNGAQLFATNENVATNAQDISDLKDLSNITTAGETVVKDLAKDAVKVEAGDRVTVTSAENNGAMVYTVSANNDGAVVQGDTNLVSGDTVYSAIEDAKEEVNDATDIKLADYALKDASNVASDADNWATAIGTGTVDPADGKLVTGATVAGETRVAADGNYVTIANTAGENITALDTAVKANEDAIADLGTDKANVELDNISTEGETVIKDLAKEAVKVVNGDNTTVTEGTDGDAKTYAVHTVTDGVVEAGNAGIVTGDTVYNAIENSKTKYFGVKATGTYNPNEDGSGATGDNSIAIGTSPMAMGNESIAMGSLSATMAEGGVAVGYMATALGEGSVAVGSGSQAILENSTAIGAGAVAPYANSVAVGAGSEAKEANVFAVGAEGKERRIVSVAAGTADTDAVNVAQMNAMAGDKADTDLGNITDDGKEVIKENAKSAINVVGTEPITVAKTDENGVDTYTVSVTADGVVEAGNTGLVTGDTVYNETRIAQDGNYVTVANTAKDNIMALDSALKDVSNVANEAKDGLDGKANTDMDNLSDAGKTEVRTLAQEAVKVVEGEYTTVTEGTDGNAKTYAVNVKVDGRIEDGDTGLVDGGTVYNAIGDAVDTINNSMESKADTNLRNINQDGETVIRNIARDAVQIEDGDHISSERVYDANGNSVYKVSAVTDGTIASGDTGIVSGGMVYTETRPVADGNYIAVASTAGENLTALDTALKDVSNIATEAKDGLDGKAGVDLDNITTNGETVIKDLAKASVEVKAGEHVSIVKADVDGVDTYTVSTVVDGQVAEGNTGIVDGGTVFSAIKDATDSTNDALDGKANVALDNLSTDGQRALQQSAITAVKVVDGENTTVTSTYDANGNISYAVKANATGTIAQGDTGLVDGGTVYDALKAQEEASADALAEKANIDASNVNTSDADKWGEKIAVGEVAQGDVRAVSGDTVYSALQDVQTATQDALDNKANVSLDNLSDAGKDVLKVAAQTAVKVDDGDNTTVTAEYDADGNVTYKVHAIAGGIIDFDVEDMVTGDMVAKETRIREDGYVVRAGETAARNIKALDTALKATDESIATLGNNTVQYDSEQKNNVTLLGENGTKIKNVADGTLSADSKEAVNGSQLFATNENVATNAQDIADLKDLSNITTAGEIVVKDLAKEAVKVEAGDRVTVTSAENNGTMIYTVSANNDGQIAQGDTNLVSGGTVYEALQGQNQALTDALDGKADKDLGNITEDGKDVITGLTDIVSGDQHVGVASDIDRTGKKTYTITVDTNGQVASGDTGIVTGGTVYDALQTATDAIANDLDGKANVGLDNITDGGKDVITGLTDVVSGDDYSNVESAIDRNGKKTYTVTTKVEGQVAQNDAGIVTGGTVYEALQNASAETQDALDGKANIGLDNISEAGKDVITGLTEVEAGENIVVDSNVDRTGKKTYTVSAPANGQVASGNTGIVSGDTVYQALQDANSATQDALDGKANIALDNINDAGKDVITGLTEVISGDDYSKVETDVDRNGKKTYTITTKVDGSIASGDTGLVTGGQVYDAIQDQADATTDALDGKANVALDNLDSTGEEKLQTSAQTAVKVADGEHTTASTEYDANGNLTYKVNVITDGQVAQGDTNVVSGGTVYDALKTTEDNLQGAIDDLSSTVNDGLDGKANVGLDNITDAGKDVITGLTDVVSGNDKAEVTSAIDRQGKKTYTVTVKADGQVVAGDEGLVTGGTVADALQNATDDLNDTIDDLQEQVDGKANVALDNITDAGKTVLQQSAISAVKVADGTNTTVTSEYDANGNITYKVEAKATGSVNANNTGLVDGGTVYDAIQNANDAIDDKLAEKANVDASNVTDANAWGEKIATGAVAQGDVRAVSGDTVFNAMEGKMATDLSNLADSGKDVITGLIEVEAGNDNTKVESNVSREGIKTFTVSALSDGQVAQGDTGIVTGGVVYDALKDATDNLQEAVDGKANVGLDNLNDAGKTVIQQGAINAVTVADGVNTTVASEFDANGNVTYKVTAVATGAIEANNTGLVDGGTVYDALKEQADSTADALDTKANVDASNVTDSAAWAEKLGTGEVEANNEELVTGATVYDAIKEAGDATQEALDGKANVSLDNLNTDGKNVLQQSAISAVKTEAGEHTTVTPSYDANGNISYKVDVQDDGEVVAGNTGLVTGGTVADALAQASADTEEALEGKANVGLDNITTEGKNVITGLTEVVSGDDYVNVASATDQSGKKTYTVTVKMDGSIAENDTGLVTGGQVYEALKDTEDGLKEEIQDLSDSVTEGLDNKANRDMDNLTDAGKEVLQKSAQDAVKVEAGNSASVTPSYDADGNISYKVDVVTDGQAQAGDTHAVSGDTLYNAISDIQDASEGKANVSLDNIDSNGKKVITGLTEVVAGNANTEVTSSYDADGKKTYVVSALTNGQIAEGNEGIVSGGTVYDALKEQADAMAEGLDGKANVSLDNLNTDGRNTLRTSAQEAITVSGEGNAVVSPTYDANGNIDYKISITEGEVGANETGLVSGKTVYEALQEQAGDIDDKLAGKANVALDNITAEGKDVITDLTEVKAGDRYGLVERSKDNDGKVTYTVKTVVDGAVADGDEGLVTGGDVFNAVDGAKSELQDKIDTLADDTQEALDTKANRDMDNLTDTGKGAVKGLAQDAVQVVAGDNVDVTSAFDANGNKIYTVSALGQGTIASGDTGLVTGGTVFTETRPAVDGNFVAKDKSAGENLSALDTAIKETRDMIDENNSNAVKYDSVQKNTVTMEGEEGTRITNLKDARLTSDSTDAVTGKQLATTNDAVAENAEAIQDVRDTIGTMEDGEYISADGTVAENLKALDDAVVAQETATDEKLAGKANVDMDNLTDTGKQNVKDLAKEAVTVSAGDHVAVTTTEENGNIDYKVSVVVDGAVEEGNTGLVDGGMVYTAIQDATSDMVNKANTNLDNITDEGREVIRETMAEDLATKANVDASNVTDAYAWGEKIATGEIAEGDVRAVSGDTVNSAISEVNDKIQELDDKKADKDLGNITPEGEQKIKDVMAEPLAEKANIGLDNLSDEGKGVIRDVAQNAVSLEDGDTTKVSSRTDEEGNRIYKVEALAEGKIEAGDTRAVSGGTMAEFVESKIGTVKDGNHVKADKPIADNINALDAAVGKTEDGFFVKSDASVGENLNVLDEQVARNTQNISGLYQNQKVMTKEMREGFAKSAALAGLHPFENDSDQKWNVAAALGGYKGEHAGAVGVFYRPSDRVMINAGSTISDSDNLYNVGVSVALDKGSGLSKNQLKKRVGDLENIIRVMAKKIDTLEAKQMSLNGITKEFPDVPKAHWAHEAVANLHGSDIVQGYPDGEFKGEKPMTRFEYAEMLYNAINTGKDVPKEMIEEYKEELHQIEQNKKK